MTLPVLLRMIRATTTNHWEQRVETVANGNGEVSINSYCQDQADSKENITPVDDRLTCARPNGTSYQAFHSTGTIGWLVIRSDRSNPIRFQHGGRLESYLIKELIRSPFDGKLRRSRQACF